MTLPGVRIGTGLENPTDRGGLGVIVVVVLDALGGNGSICAIVAGGGGGGGRRSRSVGCSTRDDVQVDLPV